MKVKAILLDLDGTLLYTENLWEFTIKLANEKFNTNVPLDFFKILKGTTAKEKKPYYFKYLENEEMIDAYYNYQCELRLQYFKERGIEVRGGFNKLYNFAKGENIKLCIVSSSSSDMIKIKLQSAGLSVDLFDAVISIDDVKNGKPNSEPYLKALSVLKIGAEDAIAVEDTSIGICSALNAKLEVALAGSDCKVEQEYGEKIFARIDSFEQLIDYIQ